MISPKKKLRRRIDLDGIDFGSSEDPCTNQEPQMMRTELPGLKDSGFWYFSSPKRNETVRREASMRRKPPSTIQRLKEKG